MPPTITPTGSEPAKRAVALDALRGLAILAMYLSGIVPWTGLPTWMYHGQEPPPTHEFNPNHPGITWVDLVFPFFLFAMGAAIPLAQARAIERGVPAWRLALQTITRWMLLVAFAIYTQHLRPYEMSGSPDQRIWLIGLLGFIICIPMFVRLPAKWPTWLHWLVRAVGWGAAAVLLSQVRFADGGSFNVERSDIILLVLANMALMATVAWWATRTSIQARYAVMAAVFALKLTAPIDDSMFHTFAAWQPLKWAFNIDFINYLLVLLPGTIVGDLLLSRPAEPISWRPSRQWALAATTFAFVPVMLVLFHGRMNPFLAIPLALLALWLGRDPQSDSDRRLRKLITWGLVWLMVGCFLEPFQGGIKKDPPTMSYLLATPGLATLVLVAFMLLEDLRSRLLPLRFLASTGQNPMVAYQAMTNLVAPIWALTIGDWFGSITQGPYLGMVRALTQMLVLGLVVSGFTKLRIFFRS